jgi:hypothetical protein
MEDPKRDKDLSDSDAPHATLSSTDNDAPTRDMPKRES